LRNGLGKRLGKTLPATLAFDHPTPTAIAKHLVATVLRGPEMVPTQAATYDPHRVIAAKLSEAALELKNVLHKGTAGLELDDAMRSSIDQFARVFLQQFTELNQETEICSPMRVRPVANPKMRLFCFPYAGGRAESFQQWIRHLPEAIELYAFDYPRSGPAVGNLDLYVKAVVARITAFSSVPYAIAGHSLGSVIAWHVTKAVSASGGPAPGLLIASGGAPSELQTLLGRFACPEELIAAVSGTNMSPSEIPNDLVEMFLQDTQLVTGSPRIEGSIAVPILAVLGEADPVIRPDHLNQWRETTSANVDIELVAGAHHYWFEEASCKRLVTSIARRLAEFNDDDPAGMLH
jgi:surfactin synthase thioesterase subunit